MAAGPRAEPEEPVQMPGRYRVRPPPSALLDYDVVRSAPGQAPRAGSAARIDWQSADNQYRMRIEGMPDQVGERALESEGGVNDAGIAPDKASEQRAGAGASQTRFDQQAGRIGFSDSRRSYVLNVGSQDQASLMMQLAGIGLSDARQMRGVIEIFVGAASDAGIVRFEVGAEESLQSALGALSAVHLVQQVEPGQRRLELWLAPQQHWLPVRLRTTWPDGTVATQTVSRIELKP